MNAGRLRLRQLVPRRSAWRAAALRRRGRALHRHASCVVRQRAGRGVRRGCRRGRRLLGDGAGSLTVRDRLDRDADLPHRRQRTFPKETFDVAAGGRSARLDNFQQATRVDRPAAGEQAREGRPGQGPAGPAAGLRRRGRAPAARCRSPRVAGRHHLRHARRRAQPGQRRGRSGCEPAAVGWYVRRLRRMSPAEVAVARPRPGCAGRRWACQPGPSWPSRPRRRAAAASAGSPPCSPDARRCRPGRRAQGGARGRATRCSPGSAELLGVHRSRTSAQPDWFLDPVTGRDAPTRRSTLQAESPHPRSRSATSSRSGSCPGITTSPLLAAAWYLTHDDSYAERRGRAAAVLVAREPVPVRRALDQRDRARHPADQLDLDPPAARRLARRSPSCSTTTTSRCGSSLAPGVPGRVRSRGSSANNHVIAEAAGPARRRLRVPVVPDGAPRWRADAAALLERELRANTFASGVNRELATDYHRFVSELGLLAALEADAAGQPLSDRTWTLLTADDGRRRGDRRRDPAPAAAGRRRRGPGAGDRRPGSAPLERVPRARGDSGRGLRPGGRGRRPTRSACWRAGWPPAASAPPAGRSTGRRTSPTPGLTLLRTENAGRPEIWCRCDGGPHGFLSIAAHAHADALSIEVRVGGVDVLADPGTYCYHGEAELAGVLPIDDRPQHASRSTARSSRLPAGRSSGSGRPPAG